MLQEAFHTFGVETMVGGIPHYCDHPRTPNRGNLTSGTPGTSPSSKGGLKAHLPDKALTSLSSDGKSCLFGCFAFVDRCFAFLGSRFGVSSTDEDLLRCAADAGAPPLSALNLSSDEQLKKPWEVKFLSNPAAASRESAFRDDFSGAVTLEGFSRARRAITRTAGYQPTALYVGGDKIAAEFGIGKLWIKAEVERFGTTSFKALGGAWAVQRGRRFLRGFPDFLGRWEGYVLVMGDAI